MTSVLKSKSWELSTSITPARQMLPLFPYGWGEEIRRAPIVVPSASGTRHLSESPSGTSEMAIRGGFPDAAPLPHSVASMHADPGNRLPRQLEFLAGGGEMGERIRAFRWSDSVLGPPEHWPSGLRTSLRTMLTTQHPGVHLLGSGTHLLLQRCVQPLAGSGETSVDPRHARQAGLAGNLAHHRPADRPGDAR